MFSALRTDRYLYVEYATGERELYDLLVDPNELVNPLADWEDPGPPPDAVALAAQLASRLAALCDCAGESCRKA